MSKYYVIMKNSSTVSCYLSESNVDGFHIKPQNNVEYDGVEVSRLTVVEPSLIENVLKRKITKKLDAYLKYLISVLNTDDDDTDPDDLNLVINDLQRYKQIIMNRYSKYLDPYYIRMLLSKVKLVEDELKRKIKATQKQSEYTANRRR